MRRLSKKAVLAVVLAAICILAVAAELLYRRTSASTDARRVQVRYYRQARTQRVFVHDVDYGGVVHINRHGFRGPDFDLKKAPGTFRIMVVGASTTFDPCVANDAETWPARLEYWLQQQSPNRRIQVINAGVPGYPMLDQAIRLETELYAYEPDAFIVYANHGIVSASDAFAGVESQSKTPGEVTPLPWDRWLRRNSRLYERLRPESNSAAVTTPMTDSLWDRAIEYSVSDFRRNLSAFSVVARHFGAEVVFAEINRVTGDRGPDQFTSEESATWQNALATPPAVLHEGYRRFAEVWRTVADSTGATFVSTDSMGISGPQYFCENDPIHFNSAGADLMGRRMAEILTTRGVVGGK